MANPTPHQLDRAEAPVHTRRRRMVVHRVWEGTGGVVPVAPTIPA